MATLRKAMEENRRIPDKLLLVYPVVDTRMITDSMKESILQNNLKLTMYLCSSRKQKGQSMDMMWKKNQSMCGLLLKKEFSF